MHRDQRSGAGCLHGQAWTAQIQLIGNARGEDVFIVSGLPDQKETGAFHQAAVVDQVVDQIGIHTGTGEDPDRTGKSLWCVPGVLDGLPGAFQKMTMLRVHDRRVPRAEAEEGSVEHINTVKYRSGLHVFGPCEDIGRNSGGKKLGVR